LRELTTNQKGAIAEAAITKAAVELGVEVYRPAIEGGRYDLIFAHGQRLVRVQCKWAPIYREVVVVRRFSSRRARSGVVRRFYEAGELAAFAAYCAELDQCYFIQQTVVGRSAAIHLRIRPSRNNQSHGVRWASDFEFVARLADGSRGP